jgi:3-hydroxyisobutyrate dehydrogenase
VSTLRVGFIGLGAIGAPMAHRIRAAGHALSVYNRGPARSAPFAVLGIPVAASAAALATGCDVVCICVSNGEAVEDVLFGPEGICAGAREGLLVIDLSTIHPMKSREFAQRLRRDHGVAMVDAPVSGGPAGASAGTLAVLAGGEPKDVERARAVLQSFAGRITHMGPSGCGMAGKACNQMLSFAQATVIAETLNLAARFGMDPALLPEAVAGGFADSNVMRHYGRAMVDGTYRGNTVTAVKDIDIAVDLARITGSPVPVTGLVASLFRMALAQGCTEGGLGSPMRFYSQGPLRMAPSVHSKGQ